MRELEEELVLIRRILSRIIVGDEGMFNMFTSDRVDVRGFRLVYRMVKWGVSEFKAGKGVRGLRVLGGVRVLDW